MISVVIISKDEPSLDATLDALEDRAVRDADDTEVVVVDASQRRLDWIRLRHPTVRWLDYSPPSPETVSIPHQRNAGVRLADGDVIAFTDSGCLPLPGWVAALTRPIVDGVESATTGSTVGRGEMSLYRPLTHRDGEYVTESATINLAFSRSAYERIGGFDESFAYGSDIDFTWRLVSAGYRLRLLPDAAISVDWGSPRRQLRRAFSYGRARARLYHKHPGRIRTAWRTDPVPFVYSTFLLGLPLIAVIPVYPLLLLLPAARARGQHALLTLMDHLALGAGFLAEWSAIIRG